MQEKTSVFALLLGTCQPMGQLHVDPDLSTSCSIPQAPACVLPLCTGHITWVFMPHGTHSRVVQMYLPLSQRKQLPQGKATALGDK